MDLRSSTGSASKLNANVTFSQLGAESCEYLFVVAVPFVCPVKLFHVLIMKNFESFLYLYGRKVEDGL